MNVSLFFRTANFEAVYAWLEQGRIGSVEVWGLEESRRAALLAYKADADDAFGWSNWVRQAYDDPSEICGLFDELELIVDGGAKDAAINAFPGVFTVGDR
ncbi:MAG: hypothetical protein P4M09_02355 [Devosia sp.]|nr:hypothetical protein [Devosia sp.]